MLKINMRSAAQSVKAQGVNSAYEEQVALVKTFLADKFAVSENERGKFDIIHYHTINPNYFIERLLTSDKKTVSIGYVHFLPDTVDDSIKLPGIARKVFFWYILLFYNSMDRLVAVNPDTLAKIRAYGIKKPKLQYIPNFVSDKRFFPQSMSQKREIRARYGLDAEKFTVLGVGQLQTRKGVQDFIETARKLSNIQFVWAGGFSFGKMTDGYAEIKKIAANPPQNVCFLGIAERSEMNGIYNMADMFFLPSFDELFPMSILEAQACLLPVLLRDIPVYERILDGTYLKAKDAAGFADEIGKMAADGEIYDFWVEKARECHKRYSEESIAKEWDAFYTSAYEDIGYKK